MSERGSAGGRQEVQEGDRKCMRERKCRRETGSAGGRQEVGHIGKDCLRGQEVFQNQTLQWASGTSDPAGGRASGGYQEDTLTSDPPPQENREVGDWRKNIDALSGMEGRKKKFEG